MSTVLSTKYQIVFEDMNNKRRSLDSNKMDAKEFGLYLDENWLEAFEWTYWIPPSRIIFIRKHAAKTV